MDKLKEFTYKNSNSHYFNNRTYFVPRRCPHCSHSISVSITGNNKFRYSSTKDINFLLHKCPECNKSFVSLHLRNNETKEIEFIYSYPNFIDHQHPKIIKEFSPKFVNVFKQAYTAEQMNHFDLAGAGYRIALEILVKDYAIYENPDDKDKIINKFNLFKCIENYFKDLDSTVSAHVVRKLTNDYVHYSKEFDQIDFDEIKYFLNIFILNIEMKLKIKNPPIPVPDLD